MIIASGDPLNFVLASVWSAICLSCIVLTWYAYARWKRHPNESLSHNIAVWLRGYKERLLIGFMLGLLAGSIAGFILGMFTGHWFWPVEL